MAKSSNRIVARQLPGVCTEDGDVLQGSSVVDERFWPYSAKKKVSSSIIRKVWANSEVAGKARAEL